MKQIIHKIFHRMKEDSLAKKMVEPERKKMVPDMKELKSCLIVWKADEKEGEWLKCLEEKLGKVEKDRVCFIPQGMEKIQADGVVYVKDEELKFGGKILNQQVPGILQKEYDLLIDLSEGGNVMLDYIVKNSRACCKAGMKKEGKNADIMVEGVADVTDFIGRLFIILTKLKRY